MGHGWHARYALDRPLAKDAPSLAPLQHQKVQRILKLVVVLVFVLESYQPHCAPQADQNALWRSFLHKELPFQVGIGPLRTSAVYRPGPDLPQVHGLPWVVRMFTQSHDHHRVQAAPHG